MGFLMPKAPAPPPPPPPPAPPPAYDDEERKAKVAAEQAEIKRKRKGRSATILTGPQGLTEEETLQKKTLLGE